MYTTRRLLCFVSAIAMLSPAIRSHAQKYNSIVIFGDSLSENGNDAALSYAKYGIPFPSPYGVAIAGPTSDYTYGRFTDGPDSTPASVKYQGVWVEQLAAMMPQHPVVLNSLAGGQNYAYGGALTTNGSTVVTFDNYAITVEDVGLQISQYLATKPKIDNKTLFIVWAGTNDLIGATSPAQITQAALNEASNVQRLLAAGATQILAPNLPALGLVPEVAAGGPVAVAQANAATALFNGTLAASLDVLDFVYKTKNTSIFRLDVFTLFNSAVADPAAFGLTNVTTPSQETPVNPDTYLFWDDLHPTTKGHNLLAMAAELLIEPNVCQTNSHPSFCPTGH